MTDFESNLSITKHRFTFFESLEWYDRAVVSVYAYDRAEAWDILRAQYSAKSAFVLKQID